jgi:prephenate dehydrogenase
MDKIAIIGLGLIGGSLGMGLKQAGLRNVEIVGHDKDASNTGAAKNKGAVDKVEWNIHNAVDGASMVIVATPVLAVREVFELIREDLVEGAIVTDVASTKGQVLRWASELLPDTVNFVGGHPMAGKETPGILHADPSIFKGTVYCIVPHMDATQASIDSVAGLARTLGAEPFFVDAEEHDGFVAGVSHLPMVIAASLVRATLESPARVELAKVAAGGFRDASRLAAQSPTMTRDIMVSNRDNIRRWIDAYIGELTHLRDILDGDQEQLLEYFDKAQDERVKWQVRKEGGKIEGDDDDDAMPTSGEAVRDMMLGRGLSSRIKKLTDLTKGPNRPR